jgi:hypothetical protein
MARNDSTFAITLGGHTLQVVSSIAPVRGAVEHALTGAFVITDSHPSPHWTLEVELLAGDELATVGDTSTHARLVVEEGQVEDRVLHYSADRIVVARPESRHGGPYMLRVDHRARRWTAFIASDSLRDLRWVPRLVRLYFGAFLQSEGCAYVHAATVEWEGRGILFAGNGGSGKTSLAFLACSRLGARFLSDDTTVIRPSENGSVTVFGWPRRVALGLSLLQHEPQFPEIRNRRLRREGLDFSFPTSDVLPTEWARKNRVAFDPAEFLEIFGLTTSPAAKPALVVLPKARADHDGWKVEPVPPEDTDGLLAPCGLRQMEYVTDFLGVTPHARPRPHDDAISALEKLPAISVTYGTEVKNDFERFWEDVVCRNLPDGR